MEQRPAEILKEEIECILSSLSDIASFLDVLREQVLNVPASSPSKGEGGRHDGITWALLPLWVCEAICGSYKQAIPATASLYLLRAAAEVFDDLEDADSSGSLAAKRGTAMAINTASALLILSESAIPRLKLKNVDDRTIVRVMEIISSCYTTACAGQHLDLSLPPESLISEEIYFKIAYLKSASTIECSCRVGALLAGAGPELIARFTKFGYNLGMMAQIANDLHGITSGVDIRERKMTLPAIYALANTEGEIHHQLELAFVTHSESLPDPAQIKDLLFRTGSIYYSTLKMQLYRQAAQDILDEIKQQGINVEQLMRLLE